jgi:hypothetical protein
MIVGALAGSVGNFTFAPIHLHPLLGIDVPIKAKIRTITSHAGVSTSQFTVGSTAGQNEVRQSS